MGSHAKTISQKLGDFIDMNNILLTLHGWYEMVGQAFYLNCIIDH